MSSRVVQQISSTRYALKALKGLRSGVKLRTIRDLPPAIQYPTRDIAAKEVIEHAFDHIIQTGQITSLKFTHKLPTLNGIKNTEDVDILDESAIFNDVDALKRATEVSDPVEGTGAQVREKYADAFHNLDPRLQKIMKECSTREQLRKRLEEAKLDLNVRQYMELIADPEKYNAATNLENDDYLGEAALRMRKKFSSFIDEVRFDHIQRKLVLHGDVEAKPVLENVQMSSIHDELDTEQFYLDPFEQVLVAAQQLGAIWRDEVSNENEAQVMRDFTKKENLLFKMMDGVDPDADKYQPSARSRNYRAYLSVYGDDAKTAEYLKKISHVPIPDRTRSRRNFVTGLRRQLASLRYDTPQEQRAEKAKQVSQWIREQIAQVYKHNETFDQLETAHAKESMSEKEFELFTRQAQIEENIRLAKLRDEKADLSKAMELQIQNDNYLLSAVMEEQKSHQSSLKPIVDVVRAAIEFRTSLWKEHQNELKPVVATSQLSAVLDDISGRKVNKDINNVIMTKVQAKYNELLPRPLYEKYEKIVRDILVKENKSNKHLSELHERLQLIGTQFHVKQMNLSNKQAKTEAQEKVEEFTTELLKLSREHANDPTKASVPLSHAYFTADTVTKFFDLVTKYPEIKDKLKAQYVPKDYVKKHHVPPHYMYAHKRLTSKPGTLVHPEEKKVWLRARVRDMGLTPTEKLRLEQIMFAADAHAGTHNKRYIKETGEIRLTCDMFETRETNAAYLRQMLMQLKLTAQDDTIELLPSKQKRVFTPLQDLEEYVENASKEDEQSKKALQVWNDLKKQGKARVGARETYGYGREVAAEEDDLASDEEYVYEEVVEEVTDDEEYFSETDVDELK